MNTDRPLDAVSSLKVKLGLLVGVSVVVALLLGAAGDSAGVPAWLTVPATLAAALGATQWLARGMTAPLRQMTEAAAAMATGDYRARVTATSSDEVGVLARSFNAMASDLAGADRQRRELVATVSHELRTPIAAQRAVLENIVDGISTPATVATALTQAERLSELVENLLDLSRIDGGRSRLALDDVLVADLLAEGVREAELSARSVRHDVVVTPADLVVRADPGRLRQVVANLLDNAGRHTSAGGTVRLVAAAGPTGWTLDVRDDGPGIPATDRDRVFERFGASDQGGGGSGLGLAITRWVAGLHGGTVAVVDPPAGEPGACIRVSLPIDPHPITWTTTERETPMAATSSETTSVAPTAPLPPGLGDLWPERGLGPQPAYLLGSVGVGLLAALALPDHRVGLAALLVLLTGGALMWSASVRRTRPFTVVTAVLCVLLATVTVLRDQPGIVALAVVSGAALAATAATGARSLAAILASGAAWVLSGLRGLPLLGRTLTASSRRSAIWPVLRTVAVSAVLVAVFGALFAGADAVFGHWASALVPSWNVDSLVLRAFLLVTIGGIVLAGCYLALNPPRLDRVALPAARPVSRPFEWLVPVGLVIALFAVFLAAQATAMWGGHDYLRRTTGLTYADYVHQGFGQLTVITLGTLAVLAIAVRKAPQRTDRDRLVLRVVLGTLCLLTLSVVGSALYRMHLYQEAYGFTTLRLVVDAFELWLGLLVVLVLVAGLRLQGWWLPRAALVSGAGFVLVLGLMNPDGWVAQRNIDRYHATGKLDVAYLDSLSADAIPTLARGGLPADVTRCLLAGQAGTTPDPILAWNLGRARAQALAPADPAGAERGCATVTSTEIG